MRSSLILSLLMITSMFVSEMKSRAGAEVLAPNRDAKAIRSAIEAVESSGVDDRNLILSIALLRQNAVEELNPERLLKVCKDPRTDQIHKRRCFLQLLSLHAKMPITVGAFCKLTGDGTVFKPAQVSPEPWDFDGPRGTDLLEGDWARDTIVPISLDLPGGNWARVYLRIEGNHDVSSIRSGLTDPKSPFGDLKITRIVITSSDVVDELLIRYPAKHD